MARATVAVIGGGCAGVLVTRELLRCSDDDVVLIEPGRPGGGLAYGFAQPWHLLNSRAGAMSADPADPGHFVRWANDRGLAAGPADFLSRRDYGDYLREVLAEAAAAHPGRLTVRSARVTGLTGPAGSPGAAGAAGLTGAAGSIGAAGALGVAGSLAAAGSTGVAGPLGAAGPWSVDLDDGTRVDADDVVLAVGNPQGSQPAPIRPGQPGYLADPWQPGALEALGGDAPVLLIGTGLTAVDAALTLFADGGRSAPVTAVSRRGQLPLAHTAEAAPPSAPPLDDCATLRDLVRAVRASAGEAGDWRAVVDGLRPYLDQIWVALTPAEQDAFLRHLARTWECHRHRMAPAVGRRIAALRADGALLIRAGGVRAITAAPQGGLDVEFGDGDRQWFAAVVNCAGPGKLPGSANPLVATLIEAGLARVGPHDLGLDIDPAGRLIAAGGAAQPGLWLLGPLRRGARWETTAVPEIRAQAHRLAADLTAARAPGALLEAA